MKPTHYSGTFNDISEDFYAYDAIQSVVDAGLFNGEQNGNFHPNDPITREQVALIFSNAFDLQEASKIIEFSDIEFSHPSFNAIQRLSASGITTGYEDNTYRPNDTMTRAEFAVLIHRAIN